MKSFFYYTLLFALTAAAVFTTSSISNAANLEAGKVLFQNRCIMCHSTTPSAVFSPNVIVPHLNGQKDLYLVQQLKDFKNKVRPSTVMASMVADLTDAQFTDVAAYLASLPPCP